MFWWKKKSISSGAKNKGSETVLREEDEKNEEHKFDRGKETMSDVSA